MHFFVDLARLVDAPVPDLVPGAAQLGALVQIPETGGRGQVEVMGERKRVLDDVVYSASVAFSFFLPLIPLPLERVRGNLAMDGERQPAKATTSLVEKML
ncbi:unnamed protein product [Timema podura]|uniref:Uncharacterized protein n=1 Tax=Timema podura TaxID=61482 RepID=A0ABN7P123_TIMPD|nr:unnamed protein product [Timema podura]